MTKLYCFGCGALGSAIALHLALPENSFMLIDDDRVSENNVTTGTSVYYHHQIGARKVDCLSEMLWLKGHAIADTRAETVDERNVVGMMDAPLNNIGDIAIYVDTFDNVASRRLITSHFGNPVLHVGVSINRTGMVAWDEDFPLGDPADDEDRYSNPVCTNQLGAPILRLTSVVAVSAIEMYVATGETNNFLITQSLQIKKI